MAKKAEKVFIFTNDDDALEYAGELLDSELSEENEDKIFIMYEDGQSILMNEEGTALFVQEYSSLYSD